MEGKTIFQLPAEFTGLQSKMNSSFKLTYNTQENISPEKITNLMKLLNKTGWLTFCNKEIDPEDIFDLPKINLPKSNKKTASQRLRSVLYVLYQTKSKEPTDDGFQQFYDAEMEKLINHYKGMLDG